MILTKMFFNHMESVFFNHMESVFLLSGDTKLMWEANLRIETKIRLEKFANAKRDTNKIGISLRQETQMVQVTWHSVRHMDSE